MSRARPKNPSQQDHEPVNDNLNEIIDEFKTIIPNQRDFEDRKQDFVRYDHQLRLENSLNKLSLILREMLREKLYPDPSLLCLLMKKFNLYNHLVLANALYVDASSKGVANELTHTTMIDLTGKKDRTDLAIEAYVNATNPKHYAANEDTHTRMMKIALKNNRIDLAIRVYENATDPEHYAANARIHNSMIDLANRNNRMDLAIKAYENATDPKNYAANINVHISMIIAASKNGRMDLVIKAYENATDTKHYVANVDVHIRMINAASKCGRMDLVIKAYNNATDPKNWVANAAIHISMIHAATINDRIDLAIKAYNNAIQPSHYQANYITHTIMLDALVRYCRFDEAVEVYKKSGLCLAITYSNGWHQIDLHDFSYGSVYTGLHEYIKNTTKPLQMKIIYGKGLHSKESNRNEVHDLKKSTYQLFEDLQQDYTITAKEDPTNTGQAFCQVQLKPTMFSANPAVNLANSKMNPKAASFTPAKKA